MKLSMPEQVELDFDDVVKRGRREITEVVGNIGSYVRRAVNEWGASWHPTGFMVLPLHDLERFGLVRLHIWPEGRRLKRDGNPEIHSHVFHLASYVFAGVYVEHQYVATVSTDDTSVYRGYSVVPPVGDGKDRIAPDGLRYSIERIRTEITEAGKFHNLPAGIYHLTDIGAERAATVALLSRPQPGMVDHLLGPEEHDGLVSERMPVDRAALEKNLRMLGIRW